MGDPLAGENDDPMRAQYAMADEAPPPVSGNKPVLTRSGRSLWHELFIWHELFSHRKSKSRTAAAFTIHPDTRPARQPVERLSDACKIDLAVAQLARIQRAMIDGIVVPGTRGKPRRLSVRDRDAMLLEELDRVLTAVRS
jgi:hypothetical protein